MKFKKSILFSVLLPFFLINSHQAIKAENQAEISGWFDSIDKEYLINLSEKYGHNALIGLCSISVCTLAWLGVHSYFQHYAERAEDFQTKLKALNKNDIATKRKIYEQMALNLGSSRIYNYIFSTNPLHKAVNKYLNQVAEQDKNGSKEKTLEVIAKILFGFGWGQYYLSEL